jgi:hypothetical protein
LCTRTRPTSPPTLFPPGKQSLTTNTNSDFEGDQRVHFPILKSVRFGCKLRSQVVHQTSPWASFCVKHSKRATKVTTRLTRRPTQKICCKNLASCMSLVVKRCWSSRPGDMQVDGPPRTHLLKFTLICSFLTAFFVGPHVRISSKNRCGKKQNERVTKLKTFSSAVNGPTLGTTTTARTTFRSLQTNLGSKVGVLVTVCEGGWPKIGL